MCPSPCARPLISGTDPTTPPKDTYSSVSVAGMCWPVLCCRMWKAARAYRVLWWERAALCWRSCQTLHTLVCKRDALKYAVYWPNCTHLYVEGMLWNILSVGQTAHTCMWEECFKMCCQIGQTAHTCMWKGCFEMCCQIGQTAHTCTWRWDLTVLYNNEEQLLGVFGGIKVR